MTMDTTWVPIINDRIQMDLNGEKFDIYVRKTWLDKKVIADLRLVNEEVRNGFEREVETQEDGEKFLDVQYMENLNLSENSN
ncbi:hypothetical protein HN51_046797 [Arachis hypogaea]